MEIGDTVYSTIYNNMLIVNKKLSASHDEDFYRLVNKEGEEFLHYGNEILTIEQCADIFANKELERSVLNYKK